MSRDSILAELTSPESLLPRLVKHLKKVGHDGQPKSLLRAFHGPFPNDLNPDYREAMEKHFEHLLNLKLKGTLNFKEVEVEAYKYITLPEMALAEAWLKALQTDRRRKQTA